MGRVSEIWGVNGIFQLNRAVNGRYAVDGAGCSDLIVLYYVILCIGISAINSRKTTRIPRQLPFWYSILILICSRRPETLRNSRNWLAGLGLPRVRDFPPLCSGEDP